MQVHQLEFFGLEYVCAFGRPNVALFSYRARHYHREGHVAQREWHRTHVYTNVRYWKSGPPPSRMLVAIR
jgi:hypothetical protein